MAGGGGSAVGGRTDRRPGNSRDSAAARNPAVGAYADYGLADVGVRRDGSELDAPAAVDVGKTPAAEIAAVVAQDGEGIAFHNFVGRRLADADFGGGVHLRPLRMAVVPDRHCRRGDGVFLS